MKFLLTFCLSMLFVQIFGQQKMINEACVAQRENLIKTVRVKKNKYLSKKKVDRFFNKKDSRFIQVRTVESRDFFFGSVEDDHVFKLEFIDKNELKGDAKYYLAQGEKFHKRAKETLSKLDRKMAGESFAAAIALGSTAPEALVGKAHWVLGGNRKLGISYLDEIEAKGLNNLSPFWQKEYWRASAYVLHKQKKDVDAVQISKRSLAIAEDQNSASDYYRAGHYCNLLRTISAHKESIPLLEKAIEISPNRKYYYMELGFALTQTKQYENALDSYNKAQSVRKDLLPYEYPIADEIIFYQGKLKFYLQRSDEAIKDLKLFLKRQPEHWAALQANYYLGLSYGLEENEKEMRKYVLRSADAGYGIAKNFAAEHLPGTRYHENKRLDDLLVAVWTPVIKSLIIAAANGEFDSDPEYSTPQGQRRALPGEVRQRP